MNTTPQDDRPPMVKALVDRGIPYVTACDIYLEDLKPILDQERSRARVDELERLIEEGETIVHHSDVYDRLATLNQKEQSDDTL